MHAGSQPARPDETRLHGGRLHLRRTDETGCSLTVDFAHLLARSAGSLDYGAVMDRLPRRFHAHFSGIDYGPKGERKHLKTTSKFFLPLAEALVGRGVEVTLINESPQAYPDAAMMKRVIEKLFATFPFSGCRSPARAGHHSAWGRRH